VDDRGVTAAAAEPTGQPAAQVSQTGDLADPADLAVTLIGEPTVSLSVGLPDDEASVPPVVTAEWALWGKEAHESAYHVLRSSKGTFVPDDFREIITRYAPGVKDDLPQYTVCWIPGQNKEPEYLAVAVHELAAADPRRSGGRSRHDANGREIEFVRLFCVRYADLARHAVSYQELVEAVQNQQLPPGPADPITVELPSRTSATSAQAAAGPDRELAEQVASLLLTSRPVCVLGADDVPAAKRLHFIDAVMSLLPYGLRTTFSASTWASSTAQDLKLRLFFANAKRDDGGQTGYVTWGQSGPVRFAGRDGAAAGLYRGWLKDAGAGAPDLLAGQTQPVRFNAAAIRQMVGNLPTDKPVAETLDDLGASLRAGDVPAVQAAVKRLQRYLAGHQEPADRYEYRRLITWHGLLKDHPGLRAPAKASVYRALLRLAFDVPLSYASYCEIEDCLDGPPRGLLAAVMIELQFADYLSWILTHMAVPRPDADKLIASLHHQGVCSNAPIDLVERHAGGLLRPAHGKVALDFAVWYLCRYAENPRLELACRGYLARPYEIVFPGEPAQQQRRLLDVLRFVFGDSLSRGQIADIFDQPGLYPSVALEAAVARMARHKGRTHISERTAIARLRYAGFADEAATVQRGRRLRARALRPAAFWRSSVMRR
jgi:hypothetical protein